MSCARHIPGISHGNDTHGHIPGIYQVYTTDFQSMGIPDDTHTYLYIISYNTIYFGSGWNRLARPQMRRQPAPVVGGAGWLFESLCFLCPMLTPFWRAIIPLWTSRVSILEKIASTWGLITSRQMQRGQYVLLLCAGIQLFLQRNVSTQAILQEN